MACQSLCNQSLNPIMTYGSRSNPSLDPSMSYLRLSNPSLDYSTTYWPLSKPSLDPSTTCWYLAQHAGTLVTHHWTIAWYTDSLLQHLGTLGLHSDSILGIISLDLIITLLTHIWNSTLKHIPNRWKRGCYRYMKCWTKTCLYVPLSLSGLFRSFTEDQGVIYGAERLLDWQIKHRFPPRVSIMVVELSDSFISYESENNLHKSYSTACHDANVTFVIELKFLSTIEQYIFKYTNCISKSKIPVGFMMWWWWCSYIMVVVGWKTLHTRPKWCVITWLQLYSAWACHCLCYFSFYDTGDILV